MKKTAYEMRISDWSSDVCSSDLDGFSGGGIYHDGAGGKHFGSPVIALEAIQASEVRNNLERIKPRPIRSQHYFVDVKPENIACLHAVLASRGHAARVGQHVHLHSAEFIPALPTTAHKPQYFATAQPIGRRYCRAYGAQ